MKMSIKEEEVGFRLDNSHATVKLKCNYNNQTLIEFIAAKRCIDLWPCWTNFFGPAGNGVKEEGED